MLTRPDHSMFPVDIFFFLIIDQIASYLLVKIDFDRIDCLPLYLKIQHFLFQMFSSGFRSRTYFSSGCLLLACSTFNFLDLTSKDLCKEENINFWIIRHQSPEGLLNISLKPLMQQFLQDKRITFLIILLIPGVHSFGQLRNFLEAA